MEIKCAWLFPEKADIINGSHRIRRINMHNALLPNSRIIEHYLDKPYKELLGELRDYNVVVFQNFCEEDFWLIQLLRGMGKKTLFDDCEALSGFPWQTQCMQAVNLITCCSTVLAYIRQHQGCQRVARVPDAFEVTTGSPIYDRKTLTAGYFGMGGNTWLIESMRRTVEDAGYKLLICSEWANADVKWGLDTWAETMYSCDVILCPQRVDLQPAKSNVKITQAMSMGLPIICSPLDAYKKIVVHQQNGFIADNLQEWAEALIALKDPLVRKRIGEAGKQSVADYSIQNISEHWKMVVQSIM